MVLTHDDEFITCNGCASAKKSIKSFDEKIKFAFSYSTRITNYTQRAGC